MVLLLLCTPIHSDEIFTEADKAGLIPIGQVVDRSARIARVRLVKRTPVWLFGLIRDDQRAKISSDSVCGYYYHAVVLEPLKGGAEDFDFFSAVDSDFKGFDRTYLVFVYKRDPDKFRSAINRLHGTMLISDSEKLHCKSFGELFVPVQPQLFRAFYRDAEQQGETLWLEPSSRGSVLWCKSEPGERKTGNFVVRKKRQDDKFPTLVAWTGIKKMIGEAIGNRYRFWDLERVGSC